MKFKIALNKLTGVPGSSGWAQIHDFTPVNEEMYASKGRLILLISSQSKEGDKVEGGDLIIGREILTKFHTDYFNKEGEEFNLLNSAVEKIHKDFKVNVLAAIILDSKIILSGAGKVQCWVLRNDNLAKILPSNNIFSASGILQDKDIFWMGTDSFLDKITPLLLKSNESLGTILKNPEHFDALVNLKIEKENAMPIPSITKKPEIEKTFTPHTISPLRLGIANLIDKIIKIIPQKKIYVKEEIGTFENQKSKKTATLAGAILLFLLLLSIVFGLRKQNINALQSKYEPILNSAQHNLDEAKSLSAIDSSRASSLILTAKSQIDSLKDQKIKDPRITALASEINDALGSVAGLYQEDVNLYLDLGLLSSGMKGDDISASDNRMAILDRGGKRLVSIDIDTTKSTVVAGPDIMPNAVGIAAYSDRNFVSASDGIWSVGDKAENIIKTDWGNNILISAYTGNFYILDKDNSTVWRYQGDGGVFTGKSNWFGSGVKPDLSRVVSWTIDGNIWMLSENEILRFSGGSPIDFSIRNADKPLEAIDIFTTQDSKYLYILDSGNSRVLVIDKEGNYKAQYLNDNIKNAKKIVVSETGSKIILLEGDKLYSLDIKHL